ncbi:MAG: sulfatase-like hydrolase/transferase, partial [Bacteroidales bacterium]|nr:sulfatase-like hydrolase/transferase [Bacteroidales bacterium]
VFAKIKSKVYHKSIHVLTCTLFCLAFLISAADIPYFNYFFNHINASIFSYFNSFDFLLRMIVEESSYLIFLFLFLGVCIGYVFLMNLIYKHTLAEEENPLPYLKSIPLALLCLLLCFVGMRGRLEMKSPLRIGTAYHCNDPFLNSVGLNPSFVLIKSVEESNKAANRNLELMDSDKANSIFEKQKSSLRNPKQELHLTKGTNVVLIIMESMSAEKSGYFNPESRLTPNLDKIADSSLSFEQAYTAGIHTYNGVYSTLFSHPALFDRHSMKASLIPTMDGLPNVLAEKGYQTLYFTTHDSQFDNIAGFLFANGIQKIISQEKNLLSLFIILSSTTMMKVQRAQHIRVT